MLVILLSAAFLPLLAAAPTERRDQPVVEGNGACPAHFSVHGIKAILVDRRGWVWFGTKGGLACWRDGRLVELGPDDGFSRRDVRAPPVELLRKAKSDGDNGDAWGRRTGVS